ncbi:carbon monoxide dehydrogenase, partial [Streptomyces scabiei]|nr:carbon monoxide dehydrogenase [Streptomyces scabiei]
SRAESEPEPPASVFDTDVPPSALDPFDEEDFVAGGEPPAEAAHARRTMIGRSAEEVDHAPPRGRYAPVPAPEPVSASATLRWAAPAAALAVASAIVVTRALRRRR